MMRKMHTSNAIQGTKFAQMVFDSKGKTLPSFDMPSDGKYIEKMIAFEGNKIPGLSIFNGGSRVSAFVRQSTVHETRVQVERMLGRFVFCTPASSGGIGETVSGIIDEILLSNDIVDNLSRIRSVDDYTFEHSVNVCILSLVTGITMEFDSCLLKDLAVGALLHDIGKLSIPQEILKKPSQLTVEEFEEIKKHTVYGYEILKNSRDISMVSAFIAFGHHERLDGSGYPLQLKGEGIHKCAKIVAVADVYDALTSDRVYRKKLRPHDAVEYVASLKTYSFDQDIVSSFVRHLAVYTEGTGVLLNTNEKGVVTRLNIHQPTRPVVRVIQSDKGERLVEPYEIDLSKKLGVCIVDSCEI